jgi:hypothetical protein
MINIIIYILNIIIIIVIKSINIKNRRKLKKNIITIIIIVIVIVKKNFEKILLYKFWSDKFNIIINMIKYYYLSYKYFYYYN